MENQLEELVKRYSRLTEKLTEPGVLSDPKKLAEVSGEVKRLKGLVTAYQELKRTKTKLNEARSLAKEETASELKKLAEEEIKNLEEKVENLKVEVGKKLKNLEEKASSDKEAVILEVRGAAGGDEAKIWAADLLRMYARFAENQGWQIEPLDEGVIKISNHQVYEKLKYESGVHRVQRIPATEAYGRIHTSTATVAVLPEIEKSQFQIKPEEIEFQAFRASTQGGQNVQKVSTAVRLKHKPTGVTVTCQTQRYQHQNRKIAMDHLRAKLWALEEEKKQRAISHKRRAQIGKGMRAEKIRTYNFPQNRVTDHRVGKAYHDLQAILDGNLEIIIRDLRGRKFN